MLTVTLKYPVDVKGQKYSVINLRRPKVKDTKMLMDATSGSGSVDANNRFLAQLAQIPPEVFDELDLYDNKQIEKALESFTQDIET